MWYTLCAILEFTTTILELSPAATRIVGKLLFFRFTLRENNLVYKEKYHHGDTAV